MNKIKLAVLAFAVLTGVATLAPAYEVSAANENTKTQILEGARRTGTEGGPTLETRISTITSVMLFIVGAIAVIMIIVGGIKYTISNGDASKVTSAKNTIMYSVVGLVVALLAYAIVRFVINQV